MSLLSGIELLQRGIFDSSIHSLIDLRANSLLRLSSFLCDSIMGKKSKRRGGGKPKEDTTENVANTVAATLGVTDATAADFLQQVLARNPPEEIFRGHKFLVTKRLKVARGIGALDEHRFVFDRIFVRTVAAAESIRALPDHVSSIDDDIVEFLKETSHDFVNSPITDDVKSHAYFATLMAWCKIAMFSCHSHLGGTEALVPLFDKDAADLLRRVSSNDDEPMPLRTMAMVARATIMCRNCNELNEASYRRRANFVFCSNR